jgi:hypothetical protein
VIDILASVSKKPDAHRVSPKKKGIVFCDIFILENEKIFDPSFQRNCSTSKMTIRNIKILTGFRFLFGSCQWEELCIKLSEYESDSGSESDLESGSDSGSEECGSDCESEHGSVDLDEATKNVYDNFEKFFEKTFEGYHVDVNYNITRCVHENEGMNWMIDIGFEIGKYSILGYHKDSHCSLDQIPQSLKEAQKKTFLNKLNKTFLWDYCVNKEGPQLYSQPDGCLYCEFCESE